MLSHHLESALSDLKDLIKITQSDIEDIKLAQNDPQFERLSLKEEKLKSFENKKAMIDHEISKMMTTNPDKELSSLLNEQQHKLLDDLKVELNNLRDVNKKYAKLVVLVSNVYNSFLERLVPTEMQGYDRVASKESTILKVRV
jgi:cystathionine beta-lyase family protein involved in aluminum resistance